MRAAAAALGTLALGLGAWGAAPATALAAAGPPHRAAAVVESADTRRFVAWVTASGDSHALPFVVIDKQAAAISVFYPDGRLRGVGPALLGLARGDDSVPGIGQRKLESIRPDERTTPAGRFVSALGQDLGERDVVWVDYDAAISLHRVVTAKPAERRLQRLATPTPEDNRISYGCINVPADFYEAVVKPAFTGTDGIVYVLPEVRPIAEVFKGYHDVDARGAP